MIERHNKKQMSLKMPKELGEKIEQVVSEDEEMTEARFVREAIRRELQRYEQEGYQDD
jgi:predicted DNA-binding protein